jgi:hypothetical protein
VRVPLLERLELLEVAEDRPRPRDGFSCHRLFGSPRLLIVGPLVSELADHVTCAVRSNVAEGVVDDGQLRRGAAGFYVLDLVVAAVDAPFDEVPDNSAAAPGTASLGARRTGCGQRDRDGDRCEDHQGCGEASCLHVPSPLAASTSGSYHFSASAASHATLCLSILGGSTRKEALNPYELTIRLVQDWY